MTGQVNSGDTAMVRLFAWAWQALVGRGAGRTPSKRIKPLTMDEIHPYGSCARNWRPADFSDLFEPETPDAEEKRR